MVEGAHAVRDLLTRYPEQILMIVTAYGYLPKEGQGDRRVRLASSTQQYSCPDLQFSKLSDLDAPQGILAVVRQPAWDEENVLRQPTVLGIYGEHLQDPTNVGAIIRTAAALNASACGSRRNPPMSIIPRWFVRRAVCCSRCRSLPPRMCLG